ARQAERADLLRSGRFDGELEGVIGVAVLADDGLRREDLPAGAVAQKDMGQDPSTTHDQRRPPRVARKHKSLRHAADALGESAADVRYRHRQGRAALAEVEGAGTRKLVREVRLLQVSKARGVDAPPHQAVVEPGTGHCSEVGGYGFMKRAERVHGDENDTGADEGYDGRPTLYGADEEADGECEGCGKQAAEEHQRPPPGCEAWVGPGQDRQEAPLGGGAQALQAA